MARKRYPPMLKLTLKRKEAEMTICELAEKVGLNYNTISQYENGTHRLAHACRVKIRMSAAA